MIALCSHKCPLYYAPAYRLSESPITLTNFGDEALKILKDLYGILFIHPANKFSSMGASSSNNVRVKYVLRSVSSALPSITTILTRFCRALPSWPVPTVVSNGLYSLDADQIFYVVNEYSTPPTVLPTQACLCGNLPPAILPAGPVCPSVSVLHLAHRLPQKSAVTTATSRPIAALSSLSSP